LTANEPFHWRGDKTNFIDFNTTFNTLFGGASMNDADMTAFRDFINTVTFAPNPNQNLDRTYPTNFPGGGDALQGFLSFFQPINVMRNLRVLPWATAGNRDHQCHSPRRGRRNISEHESAALAEPVPEDRLQPWHGRG